MPFDVPAGVSRIEVSTSHEQFSLLGIGRNVLDLGIFGPAGHQLGNAAGFRGWSGGARAGFMLSAVNATPGYLAGPIDPGRWTLALGPVVLNPLGMDWQAQIALTRGVQPSLRRCPDCASGGVAVSRRAGWYRGDLHTHTVHSDGRRRIEEMAEAATSAGLDFIVSTDHNTNSANRAWAASTADLEVIAGEEVTTRHGHWLAVGLPPGGWVDWRYAPRDGVFAGYADQVRADGGLVVAATRRSRCPAARGSSATTTWMPWKSGTDSGMSMTNCRCASGISYSDRAAESPPSAVATPTWQDQPVGRPQTVVDAEELSAVGADRRSAARSLLRAESSSVILALNASRGRHDDRSTR